jgi:hypothetical protein
MYLRRLQSDQLYTWSDKDSRPTRRCTAEAAQRSPAPTASAESDPPRLPDRALQTMWQAGMQMRRRSRSWPQVLSFDQLPGLAAANGLRAAGVLRPDGRVSRQLPPSPRDFRGDLRDQPRIAAPTRGALIDGRERNAFLAYGTHRCGIGWRASRQYARRLVARQPELFGNCGGNR